MPQAGIHALVGATVGRTFPSQKGVRLGLIVGSVFPDLDNFAVAFATLAKWNTHGLHRTFTHSMLTVLVILALFFALSKLRRQPGWILTGFGFALGMVLHSALDLVGWFNGVNLLWPLDGWVNFWDGIRPSGWFLKLLDPLEFLCFGLYFVWLSRMAQKKQCNLDVLPVLGRWTIAMWATLLLMVPLAFHMQRGFVTVCGTAYLISVTAAIWLTIKMRQTVEAD